MDDEFGNQQVAATKKTDSSSKVSADIFYRQPQTFSECRLCTHLEATGRAHDNLFENHLSNYLTGCPKFIEATMELRKTLVSKIKVCCLRP